MISQKSTINSGSEIDPFTCDEQEFLDEMKRLDAIARVASKQAAEYYKKAKEHTAELPQSHPVVFSIVHTISVMHAEKKGIEGLNNAITFVEKFLINEGLEALSQISVPSIRQ